MGNLSSILVRKLLQIILYIKTGEEKSLRSLTWSESDSAEVIAFVVLLAPAVCLKGYQVEDVAQEAQCLSGMHRSLDCSPVLHKTRHGDKLPANSALRR